MTSGGAPLHLYTCKYQVCGAAIEVDNFTLSTLDHLNARPTNGALIRDADTGGIFVTAGGAPLLLSSCRFQNCGAAVNVDDATIANLDHLNGRPDNATLIRSGDSGAIYVVAGGAPLHLGSCAYNDCGAAVNVDDSTISSLDHLNATPTDGTLIRDGGSGAVYRIAGGAPLHLSDCAPFDGCAGFVPLDSHAVATNDHLNPSPTDGTVLRGLPSGQTWVIRGGYKSATPMSDGAVAVNDSTIAGIPDPPPLSPSTPAQQAEAVRDTPLPPSLPTTAVKPAPGRRIITLARHGKTKFTVAGTRPRSKRVVLRLTISARTAKALGRTSRVLSTTSVRGRGKRFRGVLRLTAKVEAVLRRHGTTDAKVTTSLGTVDTPLIKLRTR